MSAAYRRLREVLLPCTWIGGVFRLGQDSDQASYTRANRLRNFLSSLSRYLKIAALAICIVVFLRAVRRSLSELSSVSFARTSSTVAKYEDDLRTWYPQTSANFRSFQYPFPVRTLTLSAPSVSNPKTRPVGISPRFAKMRLWVAERTAARCGCY